MLTIPKKGDILSKLLPRESTTEPEKINKKRRKKYLTNERRSDIIDKLSNGAAVMFEN